MLQITIEDGSNLSDEADSIDILLSANRLKEIDPLIVKAVIEWDPNALAHLVTEFRDLKTRTRVALMRTPVTALPDVADESTRALLQRISSGQLLPVEEALAGTRLATFFEMGLNEHEIEELGTEMLYEWFGPYEFVKALYEIGSVVLATGQLPSALARFVDEARHRYAFQQYNAVCALCRTILEISVKDIAVAHGILPADVGNIPALASRAPDLRDLIYQLGNAAQGFLQLRDRLHRVRINTNPIIHGHRSVKKEEAISILKETLACIHEIYEVHEKSAKGQR